MYCINISNPTNPILVKKYIDNYKDYNQLDDVIIYDNFLYTNTNGGLNIYDITNPISLVRLQQSIWDSPFYQKLGEYGVFLGPSVGHIADLSNYVYMPYKGLTIMDSSSSHKILYQSISGLDDQLNRNHTYTYNNDSLTVKG